MRFVCISLFVYVLKKKKKARETQSLQRLNILQDGWNVLYVTLMCSYLHLMGRGKGIQ